MMGNNKEGRRKKKEEREKKKEKRSKRKEKRMGSRLRGKDKRE